MNAVVAEAAIAVARRVVQDIQRVWECLFESEKWEIKNLAHCLSISRVGFVNRLVTLSVVFARFGESVTLQPEIAPTCAGMV